MAANAVYEKLMSGGERPVCEVFDAHVLSCLLARAWTESQDQGQPITECVGMDGPELSALVDENFPHARADFGDLSDRALDLDGAEAALRVLLEKAAEQGDLSIHLAHALARRIRRPGDLWQEMGLRHAEELSWLLERHFEAVACRNPSGGGWKEFLLDKIGTGKA